MGPDINAEIFASRTELAEKIADEIAADLAASIDEAGRASIALSGGSTPADLYGMLSHKSLPWVKVQATLVDERWVSPEEDGSNEKLIRTTLLANDARDLKFIGLWNAAATVTEGVGPAEERLAAIPRPLDIIVLGMGEDGHTASWFPESDGLEAALSISQNRIASVRAPGGSAAGAFAERLTMTLGEVISARHIYLLIFGEQKRLVLSRVVQTMQKPSAPVGALLAKRADVRVCWAA